MELSMTEKLSDKIDKLTGEVQERNESVVALQLQIDRRIDDLHACIDAKLDSGIEKHHHHIVSLYANFRQIVFAGLAFLGAGATFLGYQSLSAIPEKFNEVIKNNVNSVRADLAEKLKGLEDDLKTKSTTIKAQADSLKDQQDKVQKAVTDVNGSLSKATQDVTTTTQEFQTNATKHDADIRKRRAEIENTIQQQLHVIMEG